VKDDRVSERRLAALALDMRLTTLTFEAMKGAKTCTPPELQQAHEAKMRAVMAYMKALR
jgi:hypothetical protein